VEFVNILAAMRVSHREFIAGNISVKTLEMLGNERRNPREGGEDGEGRGGNRPILP